MASLCGAVVNTKDSPNGLGVVRENECIIGVIGSDVSESNEGILVEDVRRPSLLDIRTVEGDDEGVIMIPASRCLVWFDLQGKMYV